MAMRSLSSSSSSSPSFTNAFSYDVFLSFRGTDTRFGFTGNLYKALSDKGIHTFIDDEDLKRGDEITPALTKAIQESRIAVPIFSVNYASSSFCLDELVTIMECVKAKGRLVLPIFYDMDPSHVRHQRETYGEALAKHEKRFQDNKEKSKNNMARLQKWKMALKQAANLSGSHFKLGDGSYEHEIIGKIVREVSRNVNRVALPIANYPVGLESQVLNIISLLDVGCDDRVHMVGIHGPGGIGKTTLAITVYNSIADNFEGLCFLENVRENSKKYGLLHLQKTLLSAVLGEKEIEISSVQHGISVVQHRLQRKKLLLILDDVDKKEQLHGIVGKLDWFGLGSTVIITTRDKHLLACHGVKRTYEVEKLNKDAALELLKWKAFKDGNVRSSYADMLNRAVDYASGLPLALEVIGSNLCGKNIQEWESALKHYQRVPAQEIQEILRVSFDALEEKEQSVFLDIACCFKGQRLKEVEGILHAHHDQCVKYQIGVLVDKSLIKISYFWMEEVITLHDLIVDMGKEIVRQESPNDPGKCSRLWSHEDIFNVLEENTGTSKIEMIHLDYQSSDEVDWDGEGFKEMKQLKTLIVRNSHFSKGPKHLPNSLRVLEWCKYPSQDFPHDFHPRKLSICKLPQSSLILLEFLSLSKKFLSMKVLKLDSCKYLTQIPDLSSVPNLEELSFTCCENLITIDYSVGLLDNLKKLCAPYCPKLRSFPPLKLPVLEKLWLSLCDNLKIFPEILEKMEHITELNLNGTNISELPSSFGNLTGLQELTVPNFLHPRSLVMMPSQLTHLTIDRQIRDKAYLVDEEIEEMRSMLLSSNIETLTIKSRFLAHGSLDLVPTLFPNLKELNLGDNKFITVLPECFNQCRFLWKLELDDCKQLREIEGIPPSLRELSALRCSSLSLSSRSMLLEQELHEAANTDFELPSLDEGRIPEWFEYQRMGGSPLSISFWYRNKIPCILLCVASPPSDYASNNFLVRVTVNGIVVELFPDRKTVLRCHEQLSVCPGHTRVVGVSLPVHEALVGKGWYHVEVMITSKKKNSSMSNFPPLQVLNLEPLQDIRIGVHVLKEKSSMEDIQFNNPYERRKLDLNLPPLQEENDDVDTELTL